MTPATPTAPVVDDTNDTFNWTNTPGYTLVTDYEYTVNTGSSYATCTAKPQPVGNNDYDIGVVGVRVKAAGADTASATLFSTADFSVYAEENLFSFPEDFSNAFWTKQRITISTDATAAPDGTLTADKLVETATTGTHTLRRNRVETNIMLTLSCYFKAAERTAADLYFNTGAAEVSAVYDLTVGGPIGGGYSGTADYRGRTARMTNVGNGWWRCELTAKKLALNTENDCYIEVDQTLLISDYLGVAGYGCYVWGAQLNRGNRAATYVPVSPPPIVGYLVG